MNNLKKTLLVMLNLMLITSVMGQNTALINADEGEFSISSPETTVYTSEIRSDERRQLINENWKFNLGDQSNAQLSHYLQGVLKKDAPYPPSAKYLHLLHVCHVV